MSDGNGLWAVAHSTEKPPRAFVANNTFSSQYLHWIQLTMFTFMKPVSPLLTICYIMIWVIHKRKRKCSMHKQKKSTVRAPVFDRHQFFGTSEHYGKAHGSLLSGWMNDDYTACSWFPTSSNVLILPSQFWQIRFESCWLHTVQSAEYWCFYGTNKLY